MNSRAAVLDRFRRADRDDALLDMMVDDYDGLAAAIEIAPDEVLAAADAATVAAGPPANPHADSFASATWDRAGKVVVADPRFLDWLGGIDPLAAVVRGASHFGLNMVCWVDGGFSKSSHSQA